ncbi:TlpA family protein disulfide reductase [Lacunimicrobium album]
MFRLLTGTTTAILLMVAFALPAEEGKRPVTPYGVLYAEWKTEAKSVDDASELSKAEKVNRKQQINSQYTTRFLKLAKEHSNDDLWLDCLIWISVEGVPGKDFDAMFDLLSDNAKTLKNTHQLQLLMSELIKRRSERLNSALLKISDTHPNFGVRGAALFAFAALTKRDAEENGDLQALANAEKLLEKVITEYPEVHTYRGKNSENATELLEDLRSPVAIMKTVPETKGKTIEGHEFDLHETIRGKIAIISFSGHWCGPCVAMHPIQKEILNRFPRESVVIIEMNSDAEKSLEKVRKKIAADGLEWTVVTDGSDGPASHQWRIAAWPTYFVVDAEGHIRRRVTGNLGETLITWVEELVGEKK